MKTFARCVVATLAILAFARPAEALQAEFTFSRPTVVRAGTVVGVTAKIRNTSDTDELLDGAFSASWDGSTYLVLQPGSVTTRYTQVNSPSGTILEGNTPGDRRINVQLDPIPPGWTAEVGFRIFIAGVLPAGVTSDQFVSVLQYTDPNVVVPITFNVGFTIIAEPILALDKNDFGATVAPGETVSYVLFVENTGSQEATGLVLTDTVPPNTTFVPSLSDSGWSCSGAQPGSVCTLTFDSLPAQQTRNFTFTLRADPPPAPAGLDEIVNEASVHDDGTNSGDREKTAGDTETTPLEAAPDLRLAKSDGGAQIRPGETVAYTLTYRNLGSQDATGVSLRETVPAFAVFDAAASAPGWSCAPGPAAGSTCTLAVGPLPAGSGPRSATFAVSAASGLPSGVTEIVNTAVVHDDGANGSDPSPGDNTASETTPLLAAPDLALEKTDGRSSVTPDEDLVYTLTYRNLGDQEAAGVVLEETVPPLTTFAPALSDPSWTCAPPAGGAGATCTLDVGDLAAGGAGSKVFAVHLDATVPSRVSFVENTATVHDDGSNGPDPTPANNQATDRTTVDAAPDLRISKSDAGVTAKPGERLVYTLTYRNTGSQGATGVVLEEAVPAETTFSPSGSDAGWRCLPASGEAGAGCTLTLGELAAGASGSTQFAVLVDSTVSASVDRLVNSVTVADDGSNGSDPTPGDNRATETTPLDAAPDLRISKSDGDATVRPGELVTYTLSFSNQGSQTATGVALNETVPEHTTFSVAASDPGWLCLPDNSAGSSCAYLLGNVAPGDAGDVTFAVTVDSPLPLAVDTILNAATISDDGSNGQDPDPDDNESTETTPVVGEADLVVTKDDGGAIAEPGGSVLYTVSFRNDGDRAAAGVTLVDVLPPNTSFDASGSSSGWTCFAGIADAAPRLAPRVAQPVTCRWVVGDLAAGAADSVALAVRVDELVPAGLEELVNSVEIFGGAEDPTPDDNRDTEITPLQAAPDLRVTKSDGGAIALAGEAIAYTLTFTNAGPQEATGVVLEETVPAYTSFSVAGSSPGWSCSPASGSAGATCTLDVGSVAAGGSDSVPFAVLVQSQLPAGVETILNTAVVRDDGANGSDPSPGDNETMESTPVDAVPDLTLTKDDGGATAAAGEPIAYSLTSRNVGSRTAAGVLLQETVPGHTRFSPSGSSPGWVCAPADAGPGATCTLALGELEADATASAIFEVIVDPDLPAGIDQVTNTALVSDDGSAGTDPTPGNNEATDSTPIERGDPGPGQALDLLLSDMLAEDVDGSRSVTAGDVLTYTVEILNLTDGSIDDPRVEIPVPEHTRYVADSVRGTEATTVALDDGTLRVGLPPLPAGARVGFAWDARIDVSLPDALDEIRAQGSAAATGVTAVPSDDPDTPELDDPTVTPLARAGGPGEPVPVPAAGPIGLAALALLVGAGAWKVLG